MRQERTCVYIDPEPAVMAVPGDRKQQPVAAGLKEVPVIELERAGVSLGGRPLWGDVDLVIRSGEFVAILGPNGAGKSTLLKALLGLMPLSRGRIAILGAPVRRGNAAIGYLPQRHGFDADVRIRGRDLVQLGLSGRRWGLPVPGLRRLWGGHRTAADEARRVDEVLELVGARAYADRPIGELSGGEQQRILIAQALVSRPRILLLDEPLDSLDLVSQQSVSALIRQISVSARIAILLVTHDVNPILPYLDRIVYIAQGRATSGTPQQIMTAETLSDLYGMPIDVLRARDGRIVVVGQPEGIGGHARA